MDRLQDMALAGLAPAIWGASYLVATEFLPGAHPIMVAFLRALPAGLVLLALTRTLPPRALWGRVAVLGTVNFALFWSLLFVAAYRLPGGVAAVLGALQPLIVLAMARAWLGSVVRLAAVFAALVGLVGVALLILTPEARLDPLGIAAGVGGAVSMSAGTVLTRKWAVGTPALTFTAWQLTAGGLILLPVVVLLQAPLPPANWNSGLGLAFLGLIGAALTYGLWFRGIARLGPNTVAPLGFLSPLTAVLLGWIVLGQALSPIQGLGVALVLGSVWTAGRVTRP